MNPPGPDLLNALTAAFTLKQDVASVCALGNGHIHHSWLLTLASGDRYVLQQINTDVFRDLPAMIANMHRVTAHINSRRHGQSRWQSLRPQLTRKGEILYVDAADRYWRCCGFIHGTHCFDQAESLEIAFEAGRGYGMFMADLADLPAPPLHETLPRFHDTPWRFECLQESVQRDAHKRARNAQAEISFAQARQSSAGRLLALRDAGKIPVRATHNDTKLNNILLDDKTHEPVCVVDLDTVMPGLSLYDFGDLVRSAGGTVAEDSPNAADMELRTDVYTAMAQGYIAGGGDTLSSLEIEWMPFSAFLITIEIGVRFLTDFLNGDVYFKTSRPNHNLERCRTQFALAASIERQLDSLRQRC